MKAHNDRLVARLSSQSSHISLTSRFNRLSLAEPPEIASFGAYGDSKRVTEWFQPRGRFHLVLFLHAGTFSLNGTVITFRHGGIFVVPPGARCRVEGHGDGDFVQCFISFYPLDSGSNVYLLPIFTQLTTTESDVWEYAIRQALTRADRTKRNQLAVAWALLWRLARPVTAIDANPYMEAATQWIEKRIREKISIAKLAAEIDISHNNLIKQFRTEFGVTPVQYVRERRAEIARGLLMNSTKPIKSIAIEVGVPDLHAFNRLIHDCLGMSPRQVRRSRRELDYFRTSEFEAPELTPPVRH